MADQIEERVLAIVRQYTEVPPEEVTLEATFDELAIDSMDGLGLLGDLEQEFDLMIPNDEALRISTVREVAESLRRHAADGAARNGVAEDGAS